MCNKPLLLNGAGAAATYPQAKLVFVPMVSTREATFRILKPVPLHETLVVQCHVKEIRGLRCYVEGSIMAADETTVFATCTALLINVKDWIV